MTAFDELYRALSGLRVLESREHLKKALQQLAFSRMPEGSIREESDGAYSFTLVGTLAFLVVCDRDPEATPKHREMANLTRRAILELSQ
jgi:hypothetical protein